MPLKDPEARRAYAREKYRRKREENPEAVRAYGREIMRRRRAENPRIVAAEREYARLRRETDRETYLATIRRYEAKHRDKRRAKCKRYDDAHLEEKRQRKRAWTIANPGKARAHELERKFREEQRTPPWADMAAMNAFYRDCPPGHHVDHIVPLMGKTVEGYRVSGLHTLANLQYLPAVENLSKNARMRPDDMVKALLPP